MSDYNPIVQSTVQGTLNSIINTLQYITTTLSNVKNQEEVLTPSDIAGLHDLLNCTKVAAESCFSQYSVQQHKTDDN